MNKNFQKIPQMNNNIQLVNMNQIKIKEVGSPINLNINLENKNNNFSSVPNIETLVKNGEARNYLNNRAKSMLEEIKEFSSQSVEVFNKVNSCMTEELHVFLKHACK